MDELVLKEVALNESAAIDEGLMTLIRQELGSQRSFASFLRNIDYASGNTRVLCGFIGEELVCTNSFMQMPFICDGKKILGYQSGFSAASSKHRGKGLWPKLMKFGEGHLSNQGASFIFGFPNPVSHPLFVKKLGYQSMPMHDILIGPAPLWRPRHPEGNLADGPLGVLRPILRENIAWKQREGGEQPIETFTFKGSFGWGKVRTATKGGLKVRYLDVGGFELASRRALAGLLKVGFSQSKVVIGHVSLNEENEYFPHFRVRRKKQSPVIIRELGDFRAEGLKLNFFGGLRDTY